MLGSGTGSRAGAHQPVTNPRSAPILCCGTEPQTNHHITSSSGMGLLKGVRKCLLEWGPLPLSLYEILVWFFLLSGPQFPHLYKGNGLESLYFDIQRTSKRQVFCCCATLAPTVFRVACRVASPPPRLPKLSWHLN